MKILLFLVLFINTLFANEKIIALSPSINEIIYALDAGDKIVGNTDFCNYPKDSLTKTKVGGYFSPNIEKIISLKPDIVIMLASSQKLSKKLNTLGIKTKILKLTTLEDIKRSIYTIGEILDKKQKANKIVQDIDKKLNSIKNIVTNKKILIVIGHNTSLVKRIFVVGDNLYLNDIINTSGNKNAFFSKRKGQPILNMENIIATNPDIVITLSPYRKKKNLTKQELINPWLRLPISAAKTKSIYVIDKEYAGISSHRITYFLDDIKRILVDARDK
ncbi:MAG: helical backbone metal receptor [Campylobacterota bacterium]|nr:helical backbone metal receptor [Campylobacterota bacterium]